MKFIDLNAQYLHKKTDIDRAIKNVIDTGNFIQGSQVKELEALLSTYIGANCITCANGTDALYVALRALGISAGDEVIVPSFTWVSTAEVVKLLNAKPVFADVKNNTFNIDIESIKSKLTDKTKAIIPVSMFGRSCEIIEICAIAKENDLFVIEDSAQAFGSKYQGLMSCSYADISTTSFFPAKPLGCYGDGGAIFSKDDEITEKINSITKHGQKGRYNYINIGVNSRLDTIQAAILIEKLKFYEEEITKRNEVALAYSNKISSDLVELPHIPDSKNRSVWAQYTLLLNEKICHKREIIMSKLRELGIPTALYYPEPLHLQSIYKNSDESLLKTENIAKRVLSLPMHPYLDEDDIQNVSVKLTKVLASML